MTSRRYFCSLPDCSYNSTISKVFKFPANESLLTLWKEMISTNYPSFNFPRDRKGHCQKYICERHFESKYINQNTGNRMYYSIPTLFSETEICSRQPSQPTEIRSEATASSSSAPPGPIRGPDMASNQSHVDDTMEFKTMVAESEQKLLTELGSSKIVFNNALELGLHSELDIKFKQEDEANEEPQDCSMDYYVVADENGTMNDVQCSGGGSQEEDHVSVVSQKDVSAWSFDITVEKEEMNTEDEAEEDDYNLHSAASNVREGTPPTNELKLENADIDLLRPFKNAKKALELDLNSDPNIKIEQEEANEKPQDCSIDYDDAVDDKEPLDMQKRLIQNELVEMLARRCSRQLRPVLTRDRRIDDMSKDIQCSGGGKEEDQAVVARKSNGTNKQYPTKENHVSKTDVSTTKSDDAVIVTNDFKDLVKHSAKSYPCSTCTYTTNTEGLLKSHLKAHSATRSYICDLCSYIATSKIRIIHHFKLHTGEKPYACKMCDKKFLESGNLNIHTGKKLYACKMCDTKFTDRGYIKSHIRIHTGEKPFVCEICGKKFSQSSHLYKHARTHTGKKLYACKMCDKKFTDRSSIKTHVRIHTGEKPYVCDICDKRFARSCSLYLHVETHAGKKPYSCVICAKKFTRKGALDRHTRTHTGEKPYACDICDKRFARSCSLYVHVGTHTGKKRYACDMCDKRFTRSSNLHIHVKTHTDESTFACEMCDKKYSLKSSLNQHFKKTHSTGVKPLSLCVQSFPATRPLSIC